MGFQWVMEAKARGAKVIHVDPRFTRTSAVADLYVPIRAGTDIAFLGGMVNYILDNELDFREYVLAYTNAATIVSEEFRDTEDLDGLFSGFDPETGTYDQTSWQYEGQEDAAATSARHRARERETAAGLEHESHGAAGAAAQTAPRRDAAAPALRLPDPQAALRPLHPGDGGAGLRHPAGAVPGGGAGLDARTPAGSAPARWSTRWAGPSTASACSTSAPARSSSCCWATWAARAAASWRCAGTPASRARPTSRRCSTCCPATCRCRTTPTTRRSTSGSTASATPAQKGFWGNADAYAVSLLKAYWGDAATPENDFCYDYLPRLTGDHGTYQQVLNMIDGKIKGYFLLGQNPAVGSAHGRAQRLGMANLDWLVVRDLFMIESATFWKDGPEIATGEIVPEECRTEVFFLPAASHVEKEGTFTQTQRLLQWREKAVDPPGDCPLRAVVLLPPRPA